jgi:hypothetical protein
MSYREIIHRVYFKCGAKYDFINDVDDSFDTTHKTFWNEAALWCEGVCVDTAGWLHSIITDRNDSWVPEIGDNEDMCDTRPGNPDFDKPETFEVDAAYVLIYTESDSNEYEVIVQYKDGKLTRLDDPIVRFANKLSPSF